MPKARIVVLQHMEACHPGIFRDLLQEDGIALQTVRLDQGEPIPDLARFDALWVMGGPQDVWQEAEHPWLIAEKATIRDAVLAHRLPYLGICLGHQLLADALGGEVRPAATPEIGVFELGLNQRGQAHPLFCGLPRVARYLQWHAAEVTRPPPGATVLAASRDCPVQAMAIGERAFGLQFHAEVDGATLSEWLAEPSAAEALVLRLGTGGPARFAAEVHEHMAELNRAARQLYANFMALL